MKNNRTWRITGLMPTLDVDDMDKAFDWYKKLGFEPDWFYPTEGNATHSGLKAGEISLMLALSTDPTGRIQKQNLYFFVKDIVAFRDHLKQHHGEEIPSLVESDYGMRDFSIEDPWGHLLTFGESISG